MKQVMDMKAMLEKIDFLTHTVQMKPKKEEAKRINKDILLNPHGSDETQLHGITWQVLLPFLTHTVQMKPEITTPNII